MLDRRLSTNGFRENGFCRRTTDARAMTVALLCRTKNCLSYGLC